jgi:hypothetical protein
MQTVTTIGLDIAKSVFLKGAALSDKMRHEITELANTLRGNLDKIVQHGKRADAIVKNMLLHSREGRANIDWLMPTPSSRRASISPIMVLAPRIRASRFRLSGRLIPLRAKSTYSRRRSPGLS